MAIYLTKGKLGFKGDISPFYYVKNKNLNNIQEETKDEEIISSEYKECIHICGLLPNDQLPGILAGASCLMTTPNSYPSGGFPTKLGEYMIAIGEDVDNKIAYMTGTIDDPIITKVLAIDEYDETQLDKARRNIYDLERRGIQQKTQGVFRLYREVDFGSYADFTRNVERDERNNLQLGTDRGAGSRTTPKVKEILFDDEGNEVSRTVRHKSRSYTAGQMAQVKANLSHNKVITLTNTAKENLK